jgi:hypothetical protein
VSIEESKSAYPHSDAPELLALRDYAQQIGIAQPGSSSAPRLRMAQADNAFDALRDLFGRGAQPSPAPNSAPDPATGATPKQSLARRQSEQSRHRRAMLNRFSSAVLSAQKPAWGDRTRLFTKRLIEDRSSRNAGRRLRIFDGLRLALSSSLG